MTPADIADQLIADTTSGSAPKRNSRAEQSRINGAKSHGPVTPEGKAVSRLNAVKSGIHSQTDLLMTDEDKQNYEESLAITRADYQPADEREMTLITLLHDATWHHDVFKAHRNYTLVLGAERQRKNFPEYADQPDIQLAAAKCANLAASLKVLNYLSREMYRLERTIVSLLQSFREYRKFRLALEEAAEKEKAEAAEAPTLDADQLNPHSPMQLAQTAAAIRYAVGRLSPEDREQFGVLAQQIFDRASAAHAESQKRTRESAPPAAPAER